MQSQEAKVSLRAKNILCLPDEHDFLISRQPGRRQHNSASNFSTTGHFRLDQAAEGRTAHAKESFRSKVKEEGEGQKHRVEKDTYFSNGRQHLARGQRSRLQ